MGGQIQISTVSDRISKELLSRTKPYERIAIEDHAFVQPQAPRSFAITETECGVHGYLDSQCGSHLSCT